MDCFKNILVVIGGEPHDSTLTRGVALAIANGASLTLMDVIPPVHQSFFSASPQHSIEELQAEHREARRQELLRLVADYVSTGIAAEVVVRVGNPAFEIVQQVLRGGHDLVIKTANTRTGLKHLLGSITRALLRTSPCPVWAIKPGSEPRYRKILAAIDPLADDPEHMGLNEQIIRLASSLAHSESAELHLVSVWSLPMERTLRSRLGAEACDLLIRQAEARVRKTLDRWHASHVPREIVATVHLPRGRASDQIAEVAARIDADLIVMGTICRTGLAGMLVGNTAEQLLDSVTCGVLALKPHGFVSPIRLTDDNHDSPRSE